MIHIRKATSEDLSVLVDFQIRLAKEIENVTLDPQIVGLGMNNLLTDPAKGFYNVAEADGEVIACHMITYEWSDWRNGTIWWLQSLYVKKTHRKQGIFKTMYDALIDTIKQSDHVIGLRLYVDKTNTAAQKTYDAIGMDGSHYTVYEWMK